MADNNKENLTAVPAMKLELVPVPVSDVDRAKAFYVEKAGFTLEVDVQPSDTMSCPVHAARVGLCDRLRDRYGGNY